MKKKQKTWMVVGLILLGVIIIASAAYFYVSSIGSKKMPKKAFDSVCITDEDCIAAANVVSDNNCCTSCGYIAINKDADTIRTAWKENVCREGVLRAKYECPMFKCRADMLKKPVCNNTKCIIPN